MPLFSRRTPVGSLVDDFCEAISRRAQGRKSAKTDIGRLRAAVALLGVKYVEDATPAHIGRVLDAKERDGVSPKTVNAFREILSRLFNFAIRERGMEFGETGRTNPVSFIRRRREPAPRIVFLEPGQQQALLEGLSPRPQLRAMVGVLIFAGLRRAEVLWLTREDVDIESRLIHVRAKTVENVSWQPKTRRNRSVPISRRLQEELVQWRSPPGTRWFFPSPQGRRWQEDNFSKSLKRAQEPMSTSWTCLHFRHTFGSMLARKGTSLFKIATLLGNSPAICQRHYAHLRAEDLAEEVDF